MSKSKPIIGSGLILAGTAIGGGMLALPLQSALGGFLPSVCICLITWFFMTATGLLILEVVLWSPKEANIISMADTTLGLFGKVCAWLLYIFLFYSLTLAYVSGGGTLTNHLFQALQWSDFSPCIAPLIFVLIFAPFVAIGAKAVDSLNRILMLGLIISFLIFIILGVGHIELNLLSRLSWPSAIVALPIVFTSFSYQGTVPTITHYLGRDPAKVKKAIIIGTTIPLLVYLLWEALIMGVIPLDLLARAQSGQETAIAPLKFVLHVPWLYTVGEFLAFFVLITSFLGVTLGLLDFLADGLKIKKNVQGRLLLSLLIFIPPLIVVMINPHIFLVALHYAGGIGCALLLGLLPILMVWRGRYRLKLKSSYSLFGGRSVLFLLILFVLFELFLML